MMNIIRTKGLSFDDVLIVPRYSEVRTRSSVDVSTTLGGIELKVPFVAANMDTVCGPKMAVAIDAVGGIGVIHRHIPLTERFASVAGNTVNVGVAFGVNENLDTVISEANRWRTPMLVLDIAHGHSKHALDALQYVRRGVNYDATFVGGNVATHEAVAAFASAGADVVKVGIGPGSVCSTRVVTGVGVPQMTAIEQCADAADRCGIQIIADGGIKRIGDAAKALAAGADAVMIGNMFAGTEESPGETIEVSGKRYKHHRGMASSEAGSAYPEGVSGLVPVKGSVASVVEQLTKGVASACSYVGAHNLAEFQRNAGFIEISSAALHESAPHDIIEA
jgi:IMP dehydrogenase